jgi:hypothetical protein
MIWVYTIFNSRKILHYAVIKNTLTGVRLTIPYGNLSSFSKEKAKEIIEEIVNKLNS